MLVLRLMLMVLTIICLMDGHAEVSSSTTGIRNGTESPVVKPNEPELQIFDRKKKKKPKKPKKPSKKKKPKPKKPKPAKLVTTTPTMTTSTLKTTTILTTPTMETTATTTDSPTTTATTFKTTTSTTSTTTSVTTTSTATTTEATSSTASITTATTTIPTTTTTTTAATTTDSGAGGECKATNGKPCIFPFKDGKDEYNECKNHGGTYFWCATAVYDSGKYKYWSYCPKDGPCPLEGDGKCRATNNKPCVFPFKDGGKEYNECADHGGQYLWCATGTNSAGMYTAWSKCPKDGSCPLPQKETTPMITSTATTDLSTAPTNESSEIDSAITDIENTLTGMDDVLQKLSITGFTESEKEVLKAMEDLNEYFSKSRLTRNNYDPVKMKWYSEKLTFGIQELTTKETISPGFRQTVTQKKRKCIHLVENAKLSKVDVGDEKRFDLSTVIKTGTVKDISSSSSCCYECKTKASDSQLYEYVSIFKECDCFKTISGVPTKTRWSYISDSGVCLSEGSCSSSKDVHTKEVWPSVLNWPVPGTSLPHSPHLGILNWLRDLALGKCMELHGMTFENNQFAVIAFSSQPTIPGRENEIKTYFAKNTEQFCAQNFVAINEIREESLANMHTEMHLIYQWYHVYPLTMKAEHRPPAPAPTDHVYLYTLNSPCAEVFQDFDVRGNVNAHGCASKLFNFAHMFLSASINIGFNYWYQSVGGSSLMDARNTFCEAVDALKCMSRATTKPDITFTKMQLQPKSQTDPNSDTNWVNSKIGDGDC